MYFRHLAAAAGIAASASAVALPQSAAPATPAASGSYQEVIYWGQNGGTGVERTSLADYCSEGNDIVVLAFVSTFGNGNAIQYSFGQTCGQGVTDGCAAIGQDIQTCQSQGKKIIVSLGGAIGAYGFSSDDDATGVANELWNMFGKGTDSSVTRPFGDAVVDGFDFDIEAVDGTANAHYPAAINQFRTLFAQDTSKSYYITGAPQCVIPEPNMGSMIQGATFDYLFVQFYNNYCSAKGGSGTFNFADWPGYIAAGDSKNAEIFMGIPASPLGANGYQTGAVYFLEPDTLQTIVSQTEGNSSFGGVMMWSAAWSDEYKNAEGGVCYYDQVVRDVLDGTTGACGLS